MSTVDGSTAGSTSATGVIKSGAGLGERSRSAPEPGIDAYLWMKPPGESDGSTGQPAQRAQPVRRAG
ncbi:glycoside hydrolase family 6 protein [Amycolatopsis suaedae]